MKISGLNKLTLTDFPNCVACIVFTQGCNYKCEFCQNSSLINNIDGLMNEEDIFEYLDKRKNILEGVVISGGEPTIHKDLKQFIKRIRSYGFKIKLDTNGSNPKILQELLDENLLDYVAMDIKNVLKDYEKIVFTKISFKSILKSIEILKNSKINYEFRTTIMKEHHNLEKILEIIKLVDKSPYYLQNFEDSECVINHNLTGFSNSELEELKEELKEYPNVKIRGLK